jgi:hypothetical protein
MRKLRLDPEELRIETFAPDAGARAPGTVHAHSYPAGCYPPPDSSPDTCDYATCAGLTCAQSCNGYTCVGCGGGGGGSSQCESAGYTYCLKDASCLNGCWPPQ